MRTYKGIKKITRNSVRLNRKRVNLQDRLKVDYLLRDKRKNTMPSVYVQNRLSNGQNGIRIKNLRSRRSIFPFNLLFGTCFCCVCSLFTCVCILLSVLCILLSAFNRYFIRFLFSFNRAFIQPELCFYPVLLSLFAWSV